MTNTTAPVGVEITDEARQAAHEAALLRRGFVGEDDACKLLAAVDAALEAARPFMISSSEVPSGQSVTPARDVSRPAEGEAVRLVAALDREAVCSLLQEWKVCPPTPGATVVERKNYRRKLTDALMEQNAEVLHAEPTTEPARPALASPATKRYREAVWRGVYSAAIQQLNPSGVADKATDAVMELATTVPTSRPALDPRAVAEAIDSHHDEDSYLPWYDAEGEIVSSAAADAVMELAVPVPTLEQIEKALSHARGEGGEFVLDGAHVYDGVQRDLATAVLALFIKGAE